MLGSNKPCPECAEEVQGAARVCRFCGHRFDASEPPPSAPSSATPERRNRRPIIASSALGLVLVVATLAFFVQSASSDDVLTDSQRSSFLEASTNLQTLCLQVGIIEKANATGETLPEDILQDAQAQLERVKTDVKTVVDVYGHHPDGKLELKSGEQERLRPSVESATRNLSSCLPEVAGPLDQVLAKHA